MVQDKIYSSQEFWELQAALASIVERPVREQYFMFTITVKREWVPGDGPVPFQGNSFQMNHEIKCTWERAIRIENFCLQKGLRFTVKEVLSY